MKLELADDTWDKESEGQPCIFNINRVENAEGCAVVLHLTSISNHIGDFALGEPGLAINEKLRQNAESGEMQMVWPGMDTDDMISAWGHEWPDNAR